MKAIKTESVRRFLVIFSVLVLITVILSTVLPINGENEVYDNTVRLHVIANSDNDYDQALKLEIRDEVLEDVGEYINDCNTKYEAEQILEKERTKLENKIRQSVKNKGYNYNVSIELGNEYYPTREYEGLSLPAGSYYSMRVNIGEAAGKNWWCVLFPPLCINSSKPDDKLIAAGFTPSQIKLLTDRNTPQYVLKFKILEMFEFLFK